MILLNKPIVTEFMSYLFHANNHPKTISSIAWKPDKEKKWNTTAKAASQDPHQLPVKTTLFTKYTLELETLNSGTFSSNNASNYI